MKYGVGDIVYILNLTSLYRIIHVDSIKRSYKIVWLGRGDKNIPQPEVYEDQIKFKLYRKAYKLERAMQ